MGALPEAPGSAALDADITLPQGRAGGIFTPESGLSGDEKSGIYKVGFVA